MLKKRAIAFVLLAICVSVGLFAEDGGAGLFGDSDSLPWWGWALILFAFSLVLGIVAVIAGVGGGVRYVPIVSALFPFHFDFVRGAGLMVAFCGAIAAGPKLLRRGLASMKLGMPMALLASVGSVFGAWIGLALPVRVVQTMLGFAVLVVVVVMAIAKKSEFPEVHKPDRLSKALGISGVYHETTSNREVAWTVHRTLPGMLLFVFIGLMAGVANIIHCNGLLYIFTGI